MTTAPEPTGSDSTRDPQPPSIPDRALSRVTSGTGLAPGTLRDQLTPGPNLLVFLRQLGCIFCRETLAELRRAVDADSSYPNVLLFFQGRPTEGRALLRSQWPGARAVADPDLEFYQDFGLEQGSLWQTLGPGPLLARQRARRAGHTQGERDGDVWRMPGTFLVENERIVWAHHYRHAGDLPDFAAIPRFLESGSASAHR